MMKSEEEMKKSNNKFVSSVPTSKNEERTDDEESDDSFRSSETDYAPQLRKKSQLFQIQWWSFFVENLCCCLRLSTSNIDSVTSG